MTSPDPDSRLEVDYAKTIQAVRLALGDTLKVFEHYAPHNAAIAKVSIRGAQQSLDAIEHLGQPQQRLVVLEHCNEIISVVKLLKGHWPRRGWFRWAEPQVRRDLLASSDYLQALLTSPI